MAKRKPAKARRAAARQAPARAGKRTAGKGADGKVTARKRTATRRTPGKRAPEAAGKVDLFREHREEYRASEREARIFVVPPGRYLALQGKGDPSAPAFGEAIGALYAMAFTMKFGVKVRGRDYKVCALESLWWGDRGCGDFSQDPRETWNYDLLIRTPEFVEAGDLETARAKLREKGNANDAIDRVRLATIDEGRCVQMLHIGPYSAERTTIGAMIERARAEGLSLAGKHHEIYLSDPRRVPSEKLRTILRHPVA